MSEKVKYFAAILDKFAGILLEAALKNYIFMLSPSLKSIKVSGAAGTKEKKPSFFIKKSKTKRIAASGLFDICRRLWYI